MGVDNSGKCLICKNRRGIEVFEYHMLFLFEMVDDSPLKQIFHLYIVLFYFHNSTQFKDIQWNLHSRTFLTQILIPINFLFVPHYHSYCHSIPTINFKFVIEITD